MFEDLEGISQAVERTERTQSVFSPRQVNYINECVEGENPSALVDRIDELSPYQPPKGVDFDPSVAEIIGPVKDQIETKYLEAPGDIEQISQISDCLSEVDEIRYENWVELSLEDRRTVLQDLEYRIAEIEHREPCELVFKPLEENHYGYQRGDRIVMNTNYVESDAFCDYKQVLDTLIHEGRHAYQEYNVNIREVCGNEQITNEWSYNLDHYISPENIWDYQAYFEQPVEVDAREFAEDVLSQYLENVA